MCKIKIRYWFECTYRGIVQFSEVLLEQSIISQPNEQLRNKERREEGVRLSRAEIFQIVGI